MSPSLSTLSGALFAGAGGTLDTKMLKECIVLMCL